MEAVKPKQHFGRLERPTPMMLDWSPEGERAFAVLYPYGVEQGLLPGPYIKLVSPPVAQLGGGR